MAAQPLTEEALQAALDAAAAERMVKQTRWTPAIDDQIWRAYHELNMTPRHIGEVLRQVHGWGSRSSVTERLHYLRTVRK